MRQIFLPTKGVYLDIVAGNALRAARINDKERRKYIRSCLKLISDSLWKGKHIVDLPFYYVGSDWAKDLGRELAAQGWVIERVRDAKTVFLAPLS